MPKMIMPDGVKVSYPSGMNKAVVVERYKKQKAAAAKSGAKQEKEIKLDEPKHEKAFSGLLDKKTENVKK